jgi:alcohol dehydrogenase class IV
MRFEIYSPQRILFGEGILKESGPLISAFGKRALMVSGLSGANPQQIIELIRPFGVAYIPYVIQGEPTIPMIEEGVQLSRNEAVDFVVAYGGGSVIDAGKAIAGLTTNPGEVMDYLEVVGAGKTLSQAGLPFIAIPTTAGTGAEATRNAVIGVPEKRIKVSLRSPFLLPRLALVDPEATYSMPAAVTASTGMDAIAQVIEPFLSKRANPFTDLYCREGMTRAGRSLLKAFKDGGDRQARQDMSFTSLLGGMALANAGLGAVHGFAGPLGGMFGAPHGAICASLLPAVIEVNHRAISRQNAPFGMADRFIEAARLVTGQTEGSVEALIDWLRWMCAEMQIPRLRDMGVARADFEHIVELAAVASSMQANLVKLDQSELVEILEMSW